MVPLKTCLKPHNLRTRLVTKVFLFLFFVPLIWIHYSRVIKIVLCGERAPLLIRAPDTARTNYFG